MKSWLKLLALTGIGLGLAACTAGISGLIRPPHYSVTYMPGDARLASTRGPIYVNILSGGDKAVLGQAVADSLKSHGPKWFLADYAPKAGDSAYELRWAFDTEEGGDAFTLCRREAPQEVKTAAKPTGVVLAAFCRGNTRLTSIRARLHDQPGSEAFARTIGHMGRLLMPPRNPERIEDCRNLEDCN